MFIFNKHATGICFRYFKNPVKRKRVRNKIFFMIKFDCNQLECTENFINNTNTVKYITIVKSVKHT